MRVRRMSEHVKQQDASVLGRVSSHNRDYTTWFDALFEGDGDEDSGGEIVKDLMCLKDGVFSMPILKLFKMGLVLIGETLVLGITMIGSPVVTTFANILLNISATATDQASMGLAIVYNLWFYYGILVAMYDKLGIEWSRSFGAKDYHLTRVKFNQGAIVLVSTFALITLPSFLYGGEILLAVGSPADLSASAGSILKKFIIANGIETMGEITKIFCLAQGHERIFGQTAALSIIPALLVGYVLVVIMKWGVVGWIYSRITYELINLSVGIYVLINYTEPQTWGLASLKDIQKGLGTYFVESFKYALGSYTEYLGYLISNYFVILTHDENQIAAFTIIESLGAIVYTFGEAFATIMRTRMNILIGKKYNQTAKNFAMFFYGVVVAFCLVSQSIVYYFRDTIANIFTGNSKELNNVFKTMVLLFVWL